MKFLRVSCFILLALFSIATAEEATEIPNDGEIDCSESIEQFGFFYGKQYSTSYNSSKYGGDTSNNTFVFKMQQAGGCEDVLNIVFDNATLDKATVFYKDDYNITTFTYDDFTGFTYGQNTNITYNVTCTNSTKYVCTTFKNQTRYVNVKGPNEQFDNTSVFFNAGYYGSTTSNEFKDFDLAIFLQQVDTTSQGDFEHWVDWDISNNITRPPIVWPVSKQKDPFQNMFAVYGNQSNSSLNIGGVHVISLNWTDLSTDYLTWLEADLQNANDEDNRKGVPWILVYASENPWCKKSTNNCTFTTKTKTTYNSTLLIKTYKLLEQYDIDFFLSYETGLSGVQFLEATGDFDDNEATFNVTYVSQKANKTESNTLTIGENDKRLSFFFVTSSRASNVNKFDFLLNDTAIMHNGDTYQNIYDVVSYTKPSPSPSPVDGSSILAFSFSVLMLVFALFI